MTALYDPDANSTLETDQLGLTLNPLGGSVVRFWLKNSGRDQELFLSNPRSDAPGGRNGAAYSVSATFGRFVGYSIPFEGKENAFEHPLDYGLHGFQADAVHHEHTLGPQEKKFTTPENFLPPNYPFPYEAWVKYLLIRNRLIVELGVKNVGTRRGPFSLTFHPWMTRTPDPARWNHLEMQANFSGILRWYGILPVPEEEPDALEEHEDFSRFRELTHPNDNSLLLASPVVQQRWTPKQPTGSTINLKMTCAEATAFHIHTGKPKRVAGEFTNCVANGYRLKDQKKIDPKYGGVVLDPNDSYIMTIDHEVTVTYDQIDG